MRQLKITKSITSRDSQALDRYLSEIDREELLSRDDEVKLSQWIRKGGPEGQKARDMLVKGNLRFVVSVSKQYQNRGMLLADLITEGNIALMKAAEKFDETLGYKFISYAVWWIRQCILQAPAEQSRIVRLPLNLVGALNRMSKAMQLFEQENERRPSPEELAELINLPEHAVGDMLRGGRRHVSFDAPLRDIEQDVALDVVEGDGEDTTLLDIMIDPDMPLADDEMMEESLRKEVDNVLASLPERQEGVLRASFGIGRQEMTLEEIGAELNLTRERVRQLRSKAIDRLRKDERTCRLRAFLSR